MDYIKSFLIGGSVIAGSKLVSEYGPPELAPLIGGMPTGIIAAYFLTTDAAKKKYFNGYVYSSFTLFLSILLISLLQNNTSININVISGTALVVWVIFTYIVINVFVIKK